MAARWSEARRIRAPRRRAPWPSALALLAPLTLGACANQPETPPAPDSERWTALAPIAAAAELPDDWTVADPFSDRTPYYPIASFTGVGTAPIARGTTRALVRSPRELASQIFLVRDGDHERWRTRILDRMGGSDPLLRLEDEGVVRTRDGVAVEYAVIRQAPGILAGEDLTYFVGRTTPPDPFLVVDAGGPTGRFEPAIVQRFVATLALDGRALAYLAGDEAVPDHGEQPGARPSFRIVPGEVITAEALRQRTGQDGRDTPLLEEHDLVEMARRRFGR
jgi:hypothetical protein